MTTAVLELTTSLLAEGLAFPESPRWRRNQLWFSDMHDGRIMTVNLAGELETRYQLETQPSGLGWQPDGTLWVVSMEDRRLLQLTPECHVRVADLAGHAPFHCNDMVIDRIGRAYIGNFGFDFEEHAQPCTTVLLRVDPDGSVHTVANDLSFPNGMVISADGKTLIVAETMANQLTAFTISDDGSLSNRRIWAALLGGATADGICLDAEEAVWVASPTSAEVLRIRMGGEITHRVPVEDQAIACMLGGPDGRCLFVLSAPIARAAKNRVTRRGRISTVNVETAGAGLP